MADRWCAYAVVRGVVFFACTMIGCGQESDLALGEGVLARAGTQSLTAEHLDTARAQLGAYAQRSFAATGGSRRLLGASIDLALLEQAAAADGYARDPRVHWYVLEEIAARELAAELERRVPRATVDGDEAGLERVLHEQADRWQSAERRSVEFAGFVNFTEASEALADLRSGRRTLESYPDRGRTVAMLRSLVEFPTLHPMLFDEGLKVGDWLPRPAFAGEYTMAARVASIEPPVLPDIHDPVVHDALVDELLAPARARAAQDYLAELAAKFPVQDAP